MRLFPPEKKNVPEGYWRNGVASSAVNTNWGKVSVKVQRLKTKAGKQTQMYLDASLDESGWSPEALDRITDLTGRVPYEEASLVAGKFGLDLSRTLANSLTHSYASSCQRNVSEQLLAAVAVKGNRVKGHAVLEPALSLLPGKQGRVMVLQVDGVCVLGQPEGGECPGMELKSAVLYPQNSPGERWMLADRCSSEDFLPQLIGLVEKAGVTPQDTLIGLGDGASWVEDALATLTELRITDVYQAAEYLDKIMQAMNWDEDERSRHRCNWYRGDVNARDWLRDHLPDPDVWLSWDDKARTACHYLETRLDAMDYADFTTRGFPIGSGQVEAMNKSVIGTRMKRSGMHWSHSGAKAMASLRAQTCARHSLIDFHLLRFEAFPVPLLSP